jgi:uncharacterized membrane protein
VDDLAVARALHVLAVVIWIGGVAMVTRVVLPSVRRGDLGPNRLQIFEVIERRFSRHARVATLIVGLSGLYMIARADLWDRFRSAEFWWMHAMVAVWLVFSVLLFVAEPLLPRRRFEHWATTQPESAFGRLQRSHWVLLALSLVTIFGAVAGSHGWSIF